MFAHEREGCLEIYERELTMVGRELHPHAHRDPRTVPDLTIKMVDQ